MRLGAIVMAVGALALAGCGGSGDDTRATSTAPDGATVTRDSTANGNLPPGAVAPESGAGGPEEGPAATEASPGESPEGPSASGELPAADRSAVADAVASYIGALDRHDAARVCALLAPRSLDLRELPRRGAGCRDSLRASIGAHPANGGPAWRRSALAEVQVERLADDRARVSATVAHHFSDRKYVSVEDDVIYLERTGGLWLLAKPSGTLYRAVGYPEPPLRALQPPAGW
jgi:hypothetical protein